MVNQVRVERSDLAPVDKDSLQRWGPYHGRREYQPAVEVRRYIVGSDVRVGIDQLRGADASVRVPAIGQKTRGGNIDLVLTREVGRVERAAVWRCACRSAQHA